MYILCSIYNLIGLQKNCSGDRLSMGMTLDWYINLENYHR